MVRLFTFYFTDIQIVRTEGKVLHGEETRKNIVGLVGKSIQKRVNMAVGNSTIENVLREF